MYNRKIRRIRKKKTSSIGSHRVVHCAQWLQNHYGATVRLWSNHVLSGPELHHNLAWFPPSMILSTLTAMAAMWQQLRLPGAARKLTGAQLSCPIHVRHPLTQKPWAMGQQSDHPHHHCHNTVWRCPCSANWGNASFASLQLYCACAAPSHLSCACAAPSHLDFSRWHWTRWGEAAQQSSMR